MRIFELNPETNLKHLLHEEYSFHIWVPRLSSTAGNIHILNLVTNNHHLWTKMDFYKKTNRLYLFWFIDSIQPIVQMRFRKLPE